MKHVILIVIIVLFYTSCGNSNQKFSAQIVSNDLIDSIQLMILDNHISKDGTGFILYKIINHSGQKVYIPIINEFVQKVIDLEDEKYNDNFYIYFYNQNNEFIPAEHWLVTPVKIKKDTISPYLDQLDSLAYKSRIKPHYLIKTGLVENLKYTFYKRDSKILNGESDMEDRVKMNINKNSYNISYSGDVFSYNMNSLQDSKIQLVLKVDSTQMKQRLLPKDLDSLRENGIKIFHGTLYSNKVPLKIGE